MSNIEISSQQIDADAQKIIRHLTSYGHETYLVGGCVRDLLLGKTPKDFDIATDATPEQIRTLFRNSRIIGRRFRLVHIFFGEKVFQVATFRTTPVQAENSLEGAEENELLIHSDNIFGTVKEDALRRDFTINGLFYDLIEQRILDYVNGMADLKNRQICMIGNPNIRFREDPIRSLRAIRFAAQLGFDIEDRTYHALMNHKHDIVKSAAPRILEELYKLLKCGASVEAFILLHETQLLEVLLPRLSYTLKTNPCFLDPYLKQLDAWVQSNKPIENATLLFILGATDFSLLAENPYPEASLLNQSISHGIDSLHAQLQIPNRDIETLYFALLKLFWPLYHHRRPQPGHEGTSAQILQIYRHLYPNFEVPVAPHARASSPFSKKKRGQRRHRTRFYSSKT